ncbi:hypothetical protein SNE40_021568 [Patella caerulea]|uniref:Uncharacterized protein n=1 Tax=Patella caerulea TaxID=87958 RepID=A0AAN8G874_PATCE
MGEKPDQKVVIGLIVLCMAFGCLLIAFASPYWVESFEKFQGRFTKIGLWEVCFNDYTFYKDYNGKRFLGCWYIFSPQIRPIWEWVSPPWFIVCQVAVSFSLLVQGLIALMLILFLVHLFPEHLHRLIVQCSAIGTLISGFVLFIELCVFGAKKEDRDWVPRPDMNYLSWSYGFACMSFIFCLLAAMLLYLGSKNFLVKNQAYNQPGSRGTHR